MDCYKVLGSSSVTARTAAAAMAMVTARTESNYHVVGFSDKLVPLGINAGMSLTDVCTEIDRVSEGQVVGAKPPFRESAGKYVNVPVCSFLWGALTNISCLYVCRFLWGH